MLAYPLNNDNNMTNADGLELEVELVEDGYVEACSVTPGWLWPFPTRTWPTSILAVRARDPWGTPKGMERETKETWGREMVSKATTTRLQNRLTNLRSRSNKSSLAIL